MDLKLYNTLTREKAAFTPLDRSNVRMYVCGPTVYDFAHIGNARPVIVFDVLYRLLRHVYGEQHVKYVRNITDVDDKINARAAERGISIRDLTEQTYQNFKDDVAALGCLPPDVEPRATDHIKEMKTLIERLVQADFAYVANDHVLFHVAAMKDYGELSRRPLDEMIAGARVEVAPYKRDPMDFVLWKPSKQDEPAWDSPSGIKAKGRPGWHIECSAMSWKHLGETFDIHGGGIDLVFPHHENEIAQSRCAFHTGLMAQVWMHNGFLQVEGEKMAKSAGNFITIRELRRSKRFGQRNWRGPVLKFAMLQTQYRQPIDWSVRLLEQSEARLERWLRFAAERTKRKENKDLMGRFVEALSDDLNTPGAFSLVDQVVDSERSTDENRYTVYQILRLLGVRTESTRVARVVELLDRQFDKVGPFHLSSTWSERFTERQQKQLASGKALSALRDRLNLHLSNSLRQQLFLQSNSSVKKYRPNTSDRFEHLFKTLGNFTKNDWKNIIATSNNRPQFESGLIKPETEMLLRINEIAELYGDLNSCIALENGLNDLAKKYLHLALPKEDEWEVRISRLIAEREKARKDRDFARSDRIRDELAKMGVVLKDNKDGTTTWEVAR